MPINLKVCGYVFYVKGKFLICFKSEGRFHLIPYLYRLQLDFVPFFAYTTTMEKRETLKDPLKTQRDVKQKTMQTETFFMFFKKRKTNRRILRKGKTRDEEI